MQQEQFVDEVDKTVTFMDEAKTVPFEPLSSACAGAVGFAVDEGNIVALNPSEKLVMVESASGALVDVADAYVSPRAVTSPAWVPEGTEALLVAPIVHDVVLADESITEACCAVARSGGVGPTMPFGGEEVMVLRLLVAVAASALATVWNTEEAIISANARESLVKISTLVGTFQDRKNDADMNDLLHQVVRLYF